MHHMKTRTFVLATLLIIQSIINLNCGAFASADGANDDDDRKSKRDFSGDPDEGSCVCGLNKEILAKIEAIVLEAGRQDQSCSVTAENNHQNGHDAIGHSTQSSSQTIHFDTSASNHGNEQPVSSLGGSLEHGSSGVAPEIQTNYGQQQQQTNEGKNDSNEQKESLVAKLTDEIKALEAQLAANLGPHNPPAQVQQNSGSSSSSIFSSLWKPQQEHQHQQSSQQQQPQQQQVQGDQEPNVPSTSSTFQILPQTTVSSTQTTSNSGSDFNGGSNIKPEQIQAVTQPDSSLDASGASSQTPSSTTSSSFLEGLPTNSINLSLDQQGNGAGQTSSNAQPSIQTVQSTLATTVPSVVSNIFSNIQDLAIQTEHNQNTGSNPGHSSNYLTSIDGSSVHLDANETADQITAQGEMLFMQWIEHQIQALHMTASMASYIRKSSLSLFRRIVKQYVERISKLGGRVEDNVRRATQIALNNTQTLTSFLLRNYLNFAGGFMQIIGEQVSRVGKQLDSTGDTIAHINLNPFDIVSNVLASLPNPSRYSEYFRAFGKYLMGETQLDSQQLNQDERRKGLLSKTMGALGKTLGSWLG